MDNPTLSVNMPTLNNTELLKAYKVLQTLMTAFESHYFSQLKECYRADVISDDVYDII